MFFSHGYSICQRPIQYYVTARISVKKWCSWSVTSLHYQSFTLFLYECLQNWCSSWKNEASDKDGQGHSVGKILEGANWKGGCMRTIFLVLQKGELFDWSCGMQITTKHPPNEKKCEKIAFSPEFSNVKIQAKKFHEFWKFLNPASSSCKILVNFWVHEQKKRSSTIPNNSSQPPPPMMLLICHCFKRTHNLPMTWKWTVS